MQNNVRVYIRTKLYWLGYSAYTYAHNYTHKLYK